MTQPIRPAGLPGQPRPQTDAQLEATDAPRNAERAEEAKETPASTSAADSPGEKVQISQQAREMLELTDLMSAARKSLDEAPDVRADRVREVRERLEAGVYETGAIRDELAHRLTSIFKDLPLDA